MNPRAHEARRGSEIWKVSRTMQRDHWLRDRKVSQGLMLRLDPKVLADLSWNVGKRLVSIFVASIDALCSPNVHCRVIPMPYGAPFPAEIATTVANCRG